MTLDRENVKRIVLGFLVAIAIIGLWLYVISLHPYTIRLEMDDNAMNAIKSINYSCLK